jgi:hypothetical protein
MKKKLVVAAILALATTAYAQLGPFNLGQLGIGNGRNGGGGGESLRDCMVGGARNTATCSIPQFHETFNRAT